MAHAAHVEHDLRAAVGAAAEVITGAAVQLHALGERVGGGLVAVVDDAARADLVDDVVAGGQRDRLQRAAVLGDIHEPHREVARAGVAGRGGRAGQGPRDQEQAEGGGAGGEHQSAAAEEVAPPRLWRRCGGPGRGLAVDGVELEQDAGSQRLRGGRPRQVAQELADPQLLFGDLTQGRIAGELGLDFGALGFGELAVDEGLERVKIVAHERAEAARLR
ncbi:hypothetical protein [Nannocystis pusilla]|uniref:hypothetical protein n=1 Tax=Nannocystis pusilla TaxID=889268 RepID=UPI003DA1EFF3